MKTKTEVSYIRERSYQRNTKGTAERPRDYSLSQPLTEPPNLDLCMRLGIKFPSKKLTQQAYCFRAMVPGLVIISRQADADSSLAAEPGSIHQLRRPKPQRSSTLNESTTATEQPPGCELSFNFRSHLSIPTQSLRTLRTISGIPIFGQSIDMLVQIREHNSNFSIRNTAWMGQAKAAHLPMSLNDPTLNTMVGPQANGPMLVQLSDGTFMYSGTHNNTQQAYLPARIVRNPYFPRAGRSSVH